jgi:hypothetical protein
VAPSNIFYVLMQDHTVTSGRRDRSSPSLSALCNHPRHCSTTPGVVATSQRCWDVRGQDTATTATVPRTGFPSTAPSNWPATAAGQPTTTPQPSKLLLYEHRTHHDASTGAGLTRTAVSSTALFSIPVTTRLPEAGPAYTWQLSRTPRISPQTNTCLSCALCPHSCTPGKDFPVGHPSLQAKHA